MRRLLQALILVEAVSTAAGAMLCFLRPDLIVGGMISGPLASQAGAVLPLAGAAWSALALLLCGTLALGSDDGRALRVMLIPVLVGDGIHVVAIAMLVEAWGAWTPSAAAQVVAVVVLFGYRALIVARPALLLSTC